MLELAESGHPARAWKRRCLSSAFDWRTVRTSSLLTRMSWINPSVNAVLHNSDIDIAAKFLF
jgi:hypothetical protein